MVTIRRLSVLAITALMVAGISGVSAVFGDSSNLINYVGTNFGPYTSSTSYDYDFATGTLTDSTSTVSIFSSSTGTLQTMFSLDPPRDPNGFGTFIGTARPYRFCSTTCDTVLYEQSALTPTFTYAYIVMYNLRGATLDQITALATQYYVKTGDCGGGSPRFSIVMSNGAEVHVYLGPFPNYTLCTQGVWHSEEGNLVTNPEARWDSTQLGGSFYGTYSEAVLLANTEGLTISAILVSTDSGWFGINTVTTETILFRNIQVNGVTRFP